MAGKRDEGVRLPPDLAVLSDGELQDLFTQVLGEFDAQVDSTEGDADARLARATELADMHDAVAAELSGRTEVAAQRDAELQALRDRVRPPEVVDEAEGGIVDAGVGVPESSSSSAPTPVAATSTTTGPTTTPPVTATLVAGGPVRTAPRKLNPNLADIRRNAPSTSRPAHRRESVLVASSEIPGVTQGSRLPDMDSLVAALHARARALPVTSRGLEAPWYPVATLQRDHRFSLDRNATPEQINDVLTAASDPEALVAAGGWCSPSEISYDFYNIVCEDGMVDIPTVGINRGGLRWPTSPTYSSITSNFWTWNETQDIAAATGTGQSGTKFCARVPCASYNEARLRCDGFCLTVGNLMEDAFPELIANHTRLTFAGHAHRLNQLRIAQLESLSTAVSGYCTTGSGTVAPLLGAVELAAIDQRERFKMCGDAVVEVILPRWIRGAMRSDLRKRTGVDLLEVADARLMNLFDLINVRVQWVTDWQINAAGLPGFSTPLTAWPTSVKFMMYPAGTFILGQGLRLSLGVVRDSVLNQTNDHTAEWMEECWLIAMVGHESLVGTVNICTDGTTGAADLTACCA